MTEEITDVVLSDDEQLITKIKNEKSYFSNTSQTKRQNWKDYYEAYNNRDSADNSSNNPYLSNLFIPKVHEAVELLAAFLAGKNQDIAVSAERKGATKKAQVAQKLLDYLWRKVIFAQDKIVKWVKQGILFGNGFIKVGWDAEKKQPFMNVISIDSIYTDYFTENIQEAPLIHRIIKDLDVIKGDERYSEKNKEKYRKLSKERYWNKKIKNTCKTCGKIFYKGRISTFCNRSCYEKSMKTNRHGVDNPCYRNGFYKKDKTKKTTNWSKHTRACSTYKKNFLLENEYLFCEICGCNCNKTLRFEVHHICYISEAPKHPELDNFKNLILLCIQCHNNLHGNKRKARQTLVKDRNLEELFGKDLLT